MDSIYNEIVLFLQTGAKMYIPVCRKNFLKFWWNEELNLLKQSSIETINLESGRKTETWPYFRQKAIKSFIISQKTTRGSTHGN